MRWSVDNQHWTISAYQHLKKLLLRSDFRGGFLCLKDRMLEKLQPIKIAKRFNWLNVILTKSKSKLTENVLNQWKKTKNITNYIYIDIYAPSSPHLAPTLLPPHKKVKIVRKQLII